MGWGAGLCFVISIHCLCHRLSMPLHSFCSCARCHSHDSRQGSGVSAGKTIASRPLHHKTLNADNLGVKSKWKAAASHQFPDKSVVFPSAVYVNVCVYSVCGLACLPLPSPSVHPSLAELKGEKQVERQPTLLGLCLTCEIQHPLRWCDTSLPMGARLILIKLWYELNLCQ